MHHTTLATPARTTNSWSSSPANTSTGSFSDSFSLSQRCHSRRSASLYAPRHTPTPYVSTNPVVTLAGTSPGGWAAGRGVRLGEM